MIRVLCVFIFLLGTVAGLSESLRRCVIMMDRHRFDDGAPITVSFPLGYNVTELEETVKILGDVVIEFRRGESAVEKERQIEKALACQRLKCAFCKEGAQCFEALYFWQSYPAFCTEERKKQHEKDCPCLFPSRPGIQFDSDHEIVIKTPQNF